MSNSALPLPNRQFGPVLRGGRPREGGADWRRIGLMLLSVVLILTLGGAGTVTALTLIELGAIPRVDIRLFDRDDDTAATNDRDPAAVPAGGAAAPTPEADAITERMNVLLVGSESREGLSDDELEALGTVDEGGDLTDTVIVLQLDPNRDRAAMLSFPRDLYLERCDGSFGRINQAFSIGEERREGAGASCLVATIEDFAGIRIDHYVRISFAGFIQAVDAIDGVTFYLEQPLQDAYAALDVPAGCVHFDGAEALGFVRARRLDLDGDYGRIARQQRFLRELLRKATSLGTLARPDRVVPLIASLSELIETDTGLDNATMLDLVQSMRDISASGVDVRAIPGTFRTASSGAEYIDPLQPQTGQLLAAFRTGDLLPEDPTGGEPQEFGPENVPPVTVLNGSDTEGLAEDTASVLQELGFQVEETGDYENFGFGGSVIFYPPEQVAAAELLAEQLGGQEIQEGRPGDSLRVVLGSGFDPEAVAVAAASQPATETPASEDATDEPPTDEPATEETPTAPQASDEAGAGPTETSDDAASDGADAGPTEEPTGPVVDGGDTTDGARGIDLDIYAGAALSPVQC